MNSVERNRSNGSTMRLRDPCNSYKCYDSIPTPSPISAEGSIKSNSMLSLNSLNTLNNAMNGNGNSGTLNSVNSVNSGTRSQNSMVSESNLHRAASLDSLANSSEQDSSEEDLERLSDSDSLTELKNLTGSTTHNEAPRKSDIEGCKSPSDPPKEPVIKAYLEKTHKKCDYKNCGFKKQEPKTELPDLIEDQEQNIINSHQANGQSPSGSANSSLKNRRTSIASSGSVSRMETIIEEPIEPKVSVKEILARFETLREAAEVNSVSKLFFVIP